MDVKYIIYLYAKKKKTVHMVLRFYFESVCELEVGKHVLYNVFRIHYKYNILVFLKYEIGDVADNKFLVQDGAPGCSMTA